MLKPLLLLTLMMTGFSFSQKDLGLTKENGVYDPNIFMANDGTFVILSGYSSFNNKKMAMTSFDANGNKIDVKKIDLIDSKLFDPETKCWYDGKYLWKDKFVISQLDISGTVTTTEINNTKLKQYDFVNAYQGRNGIEFHVSRSMNSEKGVMMPYMIINYNPEDKSYAFVDLKYVEEPMDHVAFAGTHGEDKYFVCSEKDEKTKRVNVKLMRVSPTETESMPLIDQSAELTYIPIAAVRPLNYNVGKNIYFTIHSKKEDKAIFDVYKLDPDGELSNVRFTGPSMPKGHFPVYYTEEGKNTIFTVKDDWDNRLVVSSNFNSDEEEAIFYTNGFDDLNQSGYYKAASMISGGYRRLVTIDMEGKAKFYIRAEE